jgi:hypothetical protein
MLTVLTVSSALVLTLIIRVPLRPSRENVISIPIVRRNVCARRRRLESARGFFAHTPPVEISLRALSAHKLRRSDALPVHMVRLAIIVRTPSGYGICFDDALDGGSPFKRIGRAASNSISSSSV